MLTQAPVLMFYDPDKKLTVENDACEYGLGSVLMQDGRPIAYASRSLSQTETRYSQIEKEMLAVVYGLEKFHHYTYAREVEVVTDHKPLVAIWKKPLSKAPRRLQNLLLRARNYQFEIIYRRGSDIPTADALSRTPTAKPKREEVVQSVTTYPIKDKLMQSIRDVTATDAVLTTLGDAILKGWPEEKSQVPTSLLPYYHYRDELAVSDGVIMRGERVVIPERLRKEMKKRVHTGHLGINACLRLARDVMYWPGMSSEVRQHIETCGTCATFGDKQPTESIVITDIPKWPWRKVGVDLFSWGGEDFLITVCHYSNFIEIDELRTASSGEVIKKLKAHFARNGSPETVVTDNGTQFTSADFKSFQEQWSFLHETISPGNSQANGAAEAAVKTIKRIFRNCSVSYKALLHLHNTPTEGMNTSPAQRLLGRRTRSMLPITEARLHPGYADPSKEQQMKERKRLRNISDNRTDLRPLNVNETVRMQPLDGSKKWREALVTKVLTPRSYEVEANNKVYRRNRRHLRASKVSTHSKPPEGQLRSQARARQESRRIPKITSPANRRCTDTIGSERPSHNNVDERVIRSGNDSAPAMDKARLSGRVAGSPTVDEERSSGDDGDTGCVVGSDRNVNTPPVDMDAPSRSIDTGGVTRSGRNIKRPARLITQI